MTIQEKYENWLEHTNDEIIEELRGYSEKEIEDSFYKDLSFGTGGLRGEIGAGTNKLNVYTVGKATQGLANYLNSTFKRPDIRNPKGVELGDGVSIGPKVLLDGRKGLTIGKNATIAYEAIIWSLNHDYNDIHFCGKGAYVNIGEYAWICSRSIILPGVSVGKYAVVASGAIVTKDVHR